MMDGIEHIKAIAFDADDTLWVNETLFREAEERFCEWVSDFLSADEARTRLAAVEERNMPAYGYGIKPFTRSLLEAALEVSGGRLPPATIRSIVDNGKRMLEAPVENLPGVTEAPDGHPRFRAFDHVEEIAALLRERRAHQAPVRAAEGSRP